MAVEYKFKPYTPQNLKIASPTQEDKTLKSLQAQRANLNARLRAEGIDPETLGGEFDNRNILEKALNLTPDQGLLMDFFEVINRPVEAVKSGLMATTEDKSVLAGFWRGLSGQEVTEGKEIAQEFLGLDPQTGVGKFVTNVGVDILLDPLTYLPAGFLTKQIKKLGKVGSKTITTKGKEVVETTVKNIDNIIKRADAGEEAAKKLIRNQTDIDALKANVAKGTKRGASAENLTRNTLNDYLSAEGLGDLKDNFVAVSTGSMRNVDGRSLKDVEIYYKAKDDTWVRTAVVEVKDMFSSGSAWAFKSSIDLNDIKNASNRVSAKFFDGWKKLNITIDGKNIAETVQEGLRKGTLKADEFNKLAKKMSKSDFEKLDELSTKLFFDDLEGVSHLSLRIGESETVLLSVADAKKYLKIKRTNLAFGNSPGRIGVTNIKKIFEKTGVKVPGNVLVFDASSNSIKGKGILSGKEGLEASGRGVLLQDVKSLDEAKQILNQLKDVVVKVGNDTVQVSDGVFKEGAGLFISGTTAYGGTTMIQSGLGLAENVTDDILRQADQSKNFIESVVTRTTTTPTITETLTLAGRARAGEYGSLLQRLSRAYKNFEVNFKLTFGLTYGLSPESADAVRKAYGENLFELDRRMSRLSAIQKQLVDIDPEAGVLLGEIVEAGARVENGKIIRLNRRIDKTEFLDYALKRAEDGFDIILPSFADDVARKNFLDDLNKLYSESVSIPGEKFFDVKVGKTGGTILVFEGDTLILKKDVIDFYKTRQLSNPTKEFVEFGEKALSKKSKKLLLANPNLVSDYTQLGDEILKELIDVAGFDNLPMQLSGQIGYMRHKISNDAFAKLQEKFGVKSKFMKPGSDALQPRTWFGSAQEINAALRDFQNLDMDLFDPNAFNAMADLIKVSQRKLDQARVLDIVLKGSAREGESLLKVIDNTKEGLKEKTAYDTVFSGFKEEFGALYENLSPNAKKVLDDYLSTAGYVKGNKAISMNKSAYNVLKGAEKAYIDLKPMVKFYDKFLNTWKGLTLVSPGFHLRNMFGNMFNSYAAGMDVVSQGKYLTKSITELEQFQKIGKKLAQGLDISPAETKLFDVVRGYFEHGVSQTHRGIRDLDQVMESVAQTIKGNKLKTGYNNLIRFNFNVAEKMDDVQRYALYRWSLDKTGDASKAATKVREALFDYSHLTPFEKDYMKRIFPFYTFMKNNFIFQAKNIFANPKQYARLGRSYEYAVEDLAGYSLEDLPDYAVENMWIPIPMTVTKNDKDAIAFLKANLPVGDFTELVENPFKKGVISLTAPAKLLIEFGAGRDMFTGQALSDFPGQTNAMEEGTGVLSGLRDKRGNLTITQSPLFQKILNDIGLRTPINVASAGVDLVDTLTGYQGAPEGVGDFLVRAGIVGTQEVDRMELTKLYQDLEKLRQLKQYYEQETGNQLPVLPRR
jgi:energy-coupling factor transporter ATP-binding protein EcfA2